MRLLILLTGLSVAGEAAAGPCDAIISHGLRNVAITYSEEHLNDHRFNRACRYDRSTMTDQAIASLEVEVFGYGSGGGNFDRTTTEDRIESWCNEHRQAVESSTKDISQSQTFYQGAISAWESCIALNAKGVHFQPIISGDGRTVDIAISYTALASADAVISNITTNGFECEASTSTGEAVTFPIPLGTAAVQVNCERSEPTPQEIGDQTYSVLPRGTISIRTTGDPFQLYFPEEFSPTAPDTQVQQLTALVQRNSVPVGTIVSSVLTPDVFISNYAHTGVWVLADGGPLPPSTEYERLTGQSNAPDMKVYANSSILVDRVTSALPSGQMLTSMAPSETLAADWFWIYSLRDISGNRANNDYEQDSDQFQVYEQNGTVVSQGRTLNWKHGAWGNWNQGTSTIFGIGTTPNFLHYYVKVD